MSRFYFVLLLGLATRAAAQPALLTSSAESAPRPGLLAEPVSDHVFLSPLVWSEAGPAFEGAANASQTLTAGAYVEFGAAPEAGYALNVDRVEIDLRSVEETAALEIRSSGDGFTAPLATARIGSERQTLSVLVERREGGALLFRLYATDGEVILDGTRLFGEAVASPTATVTKTLSGGEGWRMLGAPVQGMTVADLAAQNLVQGTAQQYPTAADNLYLAYNGNNADNAGDHDHGFIPAANDTDALNVGQGFIWYLYDVDYDPGLGGTSVSNELPSSLTGTGNTVLLDLDLAFPGRLFGSTDGFYLIANPFGASFDLSSIVAVSVPLGVTLQNAFQVWNPNSGATVAQGNGTPGSYVTVNRTADLINSSADDIAAWQGVFAEVTAALSTEVVTTFTFLFTGQRGGSPPFYGRTAQSAEETGEATEVDVLRFRMEGTMSSGAVAFDEGAALAFTDVSDLTWDTYDATKLASLDSPAWIAPAGPSFQDEMIDKAQEALPLELAAPHTVPLRLTSYEPGTFSLTWSGLDEIPANWSVILEDLVTGARVDLRQQTGLVFSAEAGTSVERFAVTIDPGQATATELGPDDAMLSALAPNPAIGTASARLRVATAQPVKAELYDVLGRRVAVVFEGAVAAGADLPLRVDLAELAPGPYVLRVAGDTFRASRTVTVVR